MVTVGAFVIVYILADHFLKKIGRRPAPWMWVLFWSLGLPLAWVGLAFLLGIR